MSRDSGDPAKSIVRGMIVGKYPATPKRSRASWSRGDGPFDTILGGYQVRNILEHAKGGKLLDLGCNDGKLLRKLHESHKFEWLVGVDSDKDKVTQALASSPTVLIIGHTMPVYHHSIIENYSTKEKFDTITLINVLEHVDDPVVVLKKAKELLAPDGVIIAHIPNAISLNRRLGRKMGLIEKFDDLSDADIAVGHKRFWIGADLMVAANEAGLYVPAYGGVLLKPFSNAQMQQIAEWENSTQIFDGLYELAREMPEYSSPVWAVCRR